MTTLSTMCTFEQTEARWDEADAQSLLDTEEYIPLIHMVRSSSYNLALHSFLKRAADKNHIPLIYELSLFEMSTKPTLSSLTNVVLPLLETAATLTQLKAQQYYCAKDALKLMHTLNQAYSKQINLICEVFLKNHLDGLVEKYNEKIKANRKVARDAVLEKLASGSIAIHPSRWLA